MRKRAKNRAPKLMKTPLLFTKIALLFLFSLTALDARLQVSETVATLGNQTFYTYLPGSEYRVQRTDHLGQTHYALFDGVNEIEISTNPFSLGTTSVLMPDFWDQRLSNSNSNSSLAQHLLIDEFGTVHATLHTTGLHNLSYRAFGALLDAGHEGNAWKFTGRPRDDTGLYYIRGRYYLPEAGIFIQTDPMQDGTNWVQYVMGDPVNSSDPSGFIKEMRTQPLSDGTSGWGGGPGRGGGGSSLGGGGGGNAARPVPPAPTKPQPATPGCKAPAAAGPNAPAQNSPSPSGQKPPGEYLAGKAPDQVTPGVKSLRGQHVNNQGRVEPWTAHYDQYGRQIGRTDYNAGNKAQGIPNTHHHHFNYGPGVNKQDLGHFPGEYLPITPLR